MFCRLNHTVISHYYSIFNDKKLKNLFLIFNKYKIIYEQV